MGKREAFAPGAFSWVDLATTDLEAAKAFYKAIFSWHFEDEALEGEGVYSMAKNRDTAVAGLYELREEMRAQAIPPHWDSYVTVDDVEETTALVQRHGGEVITSALDVTDAGRMAVVKDPGGAMVNLWQPTGHQGAERVNEPNCFCWNELNTRVADQAKAFFAAVFGWEYEEQTEPNPYITIKNQGRMNGGILDMEKMGLPSETPPHWLVYFNVANLQATLDTVESLGGNILAGPMELPVGPFAVVQDPQGAAFAAIQLKVVDE